MPEANRVLFSHRDVVTALLKMQKIHDGIWGLAINFGYAAGNAGASGTAINPTALVPVLAIGIQRSQELNNLSVDAAMVNPPRGTHIGLSQP